MRWTKRAVPARKHFVPDAVSEPDPDSDTAPVPESDSDPESEVVPEIDINTDIGAALVPQSHDAYCKAIFSDPKRAAALLQRYLPADVSAVVEWPTLTQVPGSFIKKNFRYLHSDLLFTARLVSLPGPGNADGAAADGNNEDATTGRSSGDKPAAVGGSAGSEVLIYVLFEHQSTVDPVMPLRLLGYMTEILRVHHSHHGLPFPPVIPFVLHQGPQTWNVPANFEDLIALPPQHAAALLPFQPKFIHKVLDLSRANPALEEPEQTQRIVLHLMKLARTDQLPEFLAWLAQELSTFDPEDPVLVVSLVYAMSTDASLDEEVIARILETNPSLRSTAMSLAERLIAKGEARGIAKGKAQGKAEGRAEGEAIGKAKGEAIGKANGEAIGKAKGKAEGEAIGKAKGTWIGSIRTLEKLSGVPVTSEEVLEQLDDAALEAKFRALERAYDEQFKRRG